MRETKVAQFKQAYRAYDTHLEIISISDIATDQFPEAFKGVAAVIHSAAPTPRRVPNAEEQLKGAVDGVLNVVQQAEKAGITRIVVTSTLLTAATPKMTFTDQGILTLDPVKLLIYSN